MRSPSAVSSLLFTASDGLQLHALDAGPRDTGRMPVVCLPGLARNAEDFRELIEAVALHAERPRRVLALDSRGRGGSAHDPNPENYSVPVELGDVLRFLETSGTGRAIFVGTSRGGILTMVMSTVRPDAIAGAVLNDIGPVIEMAGLARIKSYVGRLAPPRDYAHAVQLLRAVMESQFPAWNDATWDLYARRTWRESERGLALRYDPALSRALADIDPAVPMPDLWAQFDGLAAAPVMVVRGEHSDLLSRATVDQMLQRRAGVEAIEVKGEGHAPLLRGEQTLVPILRFIERCDG
jgi:pimeloyl-ACP methyl ester carboxylesterase